jgi:hypothetical protein
VTVDVGVRSGHSSTVRLGPAHQNGAV